MPFFHGRSSAPVNRPLHPDLAREGGSKGNGTGWNSLVISETNAAKRWAEQGFPQLVEGQLRTTQERLRVVAMIDRERELVKRRRIEQEGE